MGKKPVVKGAKTGRRDKDVRRRVLLRAWAFDEAESRGASCPCDMFPAEKVHGRVADVLDCAMRIVDLERSLQRKSGSDRGPYAGQVVLEVAGEVEGIEYGTVAKAWRRLIEAVVGLVETAAGSDFGR